VPIVTGRLTRSRLGMTPSYHGDPSQSGHDFLVQTEFGADVWTMPLLAGFQEVRLITVEFPAAQALVCKK
jgi:hypothetical protein